MKNKNNSVIHTHANSAQIFSGPIPPPEVLAKYEELTSGLADRIITMAEIQSNNRHELERNALNAQIKHAENFHREIIIGQIFAFIIAIIFFIGGLFVILRGYSITGTILSGGVLVSLVCAFIQGRKQ